MLSAPILTVPPHPPLAQNPVPKDQMNSWYTCKTVNLTNAPGEKPCTTYTVKAGDSLYTISQNTGAQITVRIGGLAMPSWERW